MKALHVLLLFCMFVCIVLTAGCVESMDPVPDSEPVYVPPHTSAPEPTPVPSGIAVSAGYYAVGGGYYVSPQVLSALFTDVFPVQYASGLAYGPKIQRKILYYEHFNITSTYAQSNRILNVTVPYALVILEFTFDGGQRTETNVRAEYQKKTFTEYVTVERIS